MSPIRGVGIPNVFATGPDIMASQLIKLFILQGLNEGEKNCCQSR
jgi:hypothetical protein